MSKAKKEKVNGVKAPAATKTEAKAKPVEGYKGQHQAGSRKGKVHEVFDRDGQEAAEKLAVKLGIKLTTAKTWCGAWRRASGKKPSTPIVKVTPKKSEVVKAKEKPKEKSKKKADEAQATA